jgi:hypothetical protein
MLEDNILTDDKVVEMDKIIHDEKLSREIADHNYELAKKCFSYEVLTDKLRLLFH